MHDLVSIVIPVHNGGRHLLEAVNSVLTQDYPNLEVVIVDNASTDGCIEGIASISDPRVRVESHGDLIPADQNWTRAVSRASGRYIKLLCADDALLPGCVTQQVAELEGAPSAVMATGRRRIVRESGEVIRPAWGLRGLQGLIPGGHAVRSCVVSGSNLLGEPAAAMFRADALHACMPWSPDAGYVIDIELYLRVLEGGDLWASQEVVSIFRVSTGSWSTSVARQQAKDYARLIDQVKLRRPQAVSESDARWGRVKSRALQSLRGLVYLSERVRT